MFQGVKSVPNPPIKSLTFPRSRSQKKYLESDAFLFSSFSVSSHSDQIFLRCFSFSEREQRVRRNYTNESNPPPNSSNYLTLGFTLMKALMMWVLFFLVNRIKKWIVVPQFSGTKKWCQPDTIQLIELVFATILITSNTATSVNPVTRKNVSIRSAASFSSFRSTMNYSSRCMFYRHTNMIHTPVSHCGCFSVNTGFFQKLHFSKNSQKIFFWTGSDVFQPGEDEL